VGATQRNDRLDEAMVRRQLSREQVATELGVDPRTVGRWIEDRDRMPFPASRLAMARILEVPVGVLWPQVATGPQGTDELLALYPCRTAMPAGYVMSLLREAHQRVDVLAFAGLWLWDAVPDFGATLAAKAANGVEVRCCLGDPDGAATRIRGQEEGLGDGLGARCRIALTYAQRWLAEHPDSLRLHDTTLYASILRFDDDVLVNWHLYGAAAADSPVVHLRRADERGTAATVINSFDRAWATSYAPTIG
jgi:transcriptional regulator with XRE-family HTH domain